MNRRAFRSLAEERLRDGEALLAARRYAGAYYLAGYAVECALKACIAKRTRRYDFPLDRRALENVYTHDLLKLMSGADLRNSLNSELAKDVVFANNWSVVLDWSENSRYELHSREDARLLLDAIRDPDHGVLRWIREHW